MELFKELCVFDPNGVVSRGIYVDEMTYIEENSDNNIDYHFSVVDYKLENNTFVPVCIKEIVLDIDDNNVFDDVVGIVQSLCYFNYSVWNSGRGYHIHMPNVWNLTPADLDNKVGVTTIKKYFTLNGKLLVDVNPYESSRGLIRGRNSYNRKASKKKKHISGTVTNKGYNWSKHYPVNVPGPNKILDTNNKFMCIKRILSTPLEELSGQRHQLMLRVISHLFHETHLPEPGKREHIERIINQWNNGSLDDSECMKLIDQVYKKGYRYGCTDYILSSWCTLDCVFNKENRKMDSNLTERVKDFYVNKYPNSIQLKDIFPTCSDFKLYPGYIIVLAGSEGSFKTTIAAFMALKMKDRKVGFFCLDEGTEEIFIRMIAQKYNKTQEEVIKVIQDSPNKVDTMMNDLKHIDFIDNVTSPSIMEGIIKSKKYDVVFIDHIGMIDMGDDYAAMRGRSKFIRRLATETNTIFIVLSHVTRSSNLTGEISMHTLKDAEMERESDAIAHTKVIRKSDTVAVVQIISEQKHRNNGNLSCYFKIYYDTFYLHEFSEEEKESILND